MNHSYYQKWQSQEHTNVQIKVNIPFLYFAAFNRQCRCFIVNHRVPFFSVSTPTFFFNFSDIFLISPTSDPSDFLLNRAVRAVCIGHVIQYSPICPQFILMKAKVKPQIFYFIIYRSLLWWSSRTLTKLNSQSQKRFNERKYQYLKYKNKNHSRPDT